MLFRSLGKMAARQNRVASVFFPVASHAAKTPPPLGSRASPSAIPSLRSALTSFGGYSAHGTLGPTFRYGAFFFVVSALADVPSARLTLSAYPTGAKRSRRRRAQCGVQICRAALVGAHLRGARFPAANLPRFRPHHNLLSPRFDSLSSRFDGERADVV